MRNSGRAIRRRFERPRARCFLRGVNAATSGEGNERVPQMPGQEDSFLCRPLSIRAIAENLRVRPLKDRFNVLGGQVHGAADGI